MFLGGGGTGVEADLLACTTTVLDKSLLAMDRALRCQVTLTRKVDDKKDATYVIDVSQLFSEGGLVSTTMASSDKLEYTLHRDPDNNSDNKPWRLLITLKSRDQGNAETARQDQTTVWARYNMTRLVVEALDKLFTLTIEPATTNPFEFLPTDQVATTIPSVVTVDGIIKSDEFVKLALGWTVSNDKIDVSAHPPTVDVVPREDDTLLYDTMMLPRCPYMSAAGSRPVTALLPNNRNGGVWDRVARLSSSDREPVDPAALRDGLSVDGFHRLVRGTHRDMQRKVNMLSTSRQRPGAVLMDDMEVLAVVASAIGVHMPQVAAEVDEEIGGVIGDIDYASPTGAGKRFMTFMSLSITFAVGVGSLIVFVRRTFRAMRQGHGSVPTAVALLCTVSMVLCILQAKHMYGVGRARDVDVLATYDSMAEAGGGGGDDTTAATTNDESKLVRYIVHTNDLIHRRLEISHDARSVQMRSTFDAVRDVFIEGAMEAGGGAGGGSTLTSVLPEVEAFVDAHMESAPDIEPDTLVPIANVLVYGRHDIRDAGTRDNLLELLLRRTRFRANAESVRTVVDTIADFIDIHREHYDTYLGDTMSMGICSYHDFSRVLARMSQGAYEERVHAPIVEMYRLTMGHRATSLHTSLITGGPAYALIITAILCMGLHVVIEVRSARARVHNRATRRSTTMATCSIMALACVLAICRIIQSDFRRKHNEKIHTVNNETTHDMLSDLRATSVDMLTNYGVNHRFPSSRLMHSVYAHFTRLYRHVLTGCGSIVGTPRIVLLPVNRTVKEVIYVTLTLCVLNVAMEGLRGKYIERSAGGATMRGN